MEERRQARRRGWKDPSAGASEDRSLVEWLARRNVLLQKSNGWFLGAEKRTAPFSTKVEPGGDGRLASGGLARRRG